MGFLPLPDLYHPMFFALATDRVRVVGDPVALIDRGVALRRRGRRAARGRRLRGARADRHHRALARPDASRDLARPRRQRAAARPSRLRRRRRRVPRRRPGRARDASCSTATPTSRWRRAGAWPRSTPSPARCAYHSATQNSHVMKWSLAALTGRQPAWRSLLEIARQRERMAGLLQKAKAMAAANKASAAAKREDEQHATHDHDHDHAHEHAVIEEPIGEGLSAPASPGKAMLQTFLREPARIAHLTRMLLGLLARDPATLPRVTAQDIGGAFGVKVLPTREDVAVLAAAVDLGRSVKWIEDRNEHLLVAGQAREETLDVEAALRDDGTLLGLRVDMTMDQGAYPAFPFSAAMYPMMIRVMMPGPYRPGRAELQHHAHRVEQGDLRRVPRSVGGRDVGARAHARPRGARPRDRSRRDPAPQHDRRRSSCRGRCSPARRSTCACRRAPRSSARSRSPTSATGPSGRRRHAPRAGASAWGSPRSSRPRRGRPTSRSRSWPAGAVASWPASRRARSSMPTARCRSSPSRCRTGRGTRRRWPRSPPTSSASRSSR